jgi:acyl carrier protein
MVERHVVEQEVIAAIADAKKLPPEQITLDSTFEQLGVDSLDSLSALFALEQRFDISISDEAAWKMRTVREVVEGLQHLLSGQVAAGDGAARRA